MTYLLHTPDCLQHDTPLYMSVHEQGDQHVSARIREEGLWEPYESQLVCELLKPGQCFIDVGANIGYYSVLAAAAVGHSGQVFAFEPDPANFALLQDNLSLNALHSVCAVNAGLSTETVSGKLYLSKDNWGDHQIYSRGEDRECIRIELLRGDDYFSDRIKRFDLLKIDTQGAEFQVIQGLEKTIRASLPNLNIIIEFWPFGLKKAGSHGHQLLDLLQSFELPVSMIDHIDHALLPCSIAELREWVDALDANPDDEGFFNLLLGPLS